MITAEIRINSILILHVYAHRLDDRDNPRDDGLNEYYYRIYSIETGKAQSGTVLHRYSHGAHGLIERLMKEVAP